MMNREKIGDNDAIRNEICVKTTEILNPIESRGKWWSK